MCRLALILIFFVVVFWWWRWWLHVDLGFFLRPLLLARVHVGISGHDDTPPQVKKPKAHQTARAEFVAKEQPPTKAEPRRNLDRMLDRYYLLYNDT